MYAAVKITRGEMWREEGSKGKMRERTVTGKRKLTYVETVLEEV